MKTGWRFARAAVPGQHNLEQGQDCGDYAGARLLATARGNVLAACICDGAGGSPRAETGARVAAEAFLSAAGDRLRDSGGVLSESDLDDFLSLAALAVTLKAFTDREPVRDYATTLVGVLLSDRWSAFVQVGDGAIVIPVAPGRWELVFEPQRGLYANETSFLTDEDARRQAHSCLWQKGLSEVCLFSGGLDRLLIRRSGHDGHDRVVNAFFNEMFPAVRRSCAAGEDMTLARALADYLAGDVINKRTDDDRSLILASRLRLVRPPADEAYAVVNAADAQEA